MEPLRRAVACHCLPQPIRRAIDTAVELGATGIQFNARQELRPTDLSDSGRRQLWHDLQAEGLTISSLAAYEVYPYVTYKATKAAMIAFTQQVAIQNAQYGIRANCILPGLMDTPMAVDTRARATGKPRAEVAAARDAKVPLRGKMGTAWDVANAALFLASDEANFITGVALPVDGGALVNIG